MSRRKKQKKGLRPFPVAAAHSPNRWERYWFGSVAAIRPYLLMKAVLLLLAFDLWLLRLRGGWRWGVDGFNVAHFGWLDAVQPLPTGGLYNGLLLLVGMLALVCAVAGAGLWMRVILALTYTYTWAQSMLDSYQHHYFLSLVLLAFIFFPRLHAREFYPAEPRQAVNASNTGKRRVSSWAYTLLAANIAIVYAFTALAKAQAETWKVLRQLLRGQKEIIKPIEAWFAAFGLSTEWPWRLVVLSVIAGEIFLAAAYLLAVRQDENRSRWLRIVAWSGFVLAVSFHGIANELLLPLRIGWFSYYMIALASIYFLPESFLWAVGSLATWPARRLAQSWSILLATWNGASARSSMGITAVGALLTALVVGFIGFALDLPGASTAGLLVAVILAIAPLLALPLRRHEEAVRYILATGLAAVLMWSAVAQSMVRFNYYRNLADYNQYQGNLEAAKEAYAKAALYGSKDKRQLLLKDGPDRGSKPAPPVVD